MSLILEETTPPPNLRTFLVRAVNPGEALTEVMRHLDSRPMCKQANVMTRGADDFGYLWSVVVELVRNTICICTAHCKTPCKGECGCEQCSTAWAVARREEEDNRQVIE